MKKYRIYFDTCENIKKNKIKNVKLMITSPPYWDLKNYEAKNQIGFNEDYQTYLDRLYQVWKGTYDVLQKNGLAIININTKSFQSSLKLLPYDFIKQMQNIGFFFKPLCIKAFSTITNLSTCLSKIFNLRSIIIFSSKN